MLKPNMESAHDHERLNDEEIFKEHPTSVHDKAVVDSAPINRGLRNKLL